MIMNKNAVNTSYFLSKRLMFTFSRAHSHTLTNATKRSQLFTRNEQTFVSARSIVSVSFFKLCFWGIMALPFGFERVPSTSKKVKSQSQEEYFSKEMKAINDNKTPELAKYIRKT